MTQDYEGFSFAAGSIQQLRYKAIKKDNNIIIKFYDSTDLEVGKIELTNLCFTESVLEFKPKGQEGIPSNYEACDGRVTILTEKGTHVCPSCGYETEYDKYNDPSYLADHRTDRCPKCLQKAWVSHPHSKDGHCLPSPYLSNYTAVSKS